jgi:hypothetical protein
MPTANCRFVGIGTRRRPAARAGAVTIEDVGNPQVVELDTAHLQAGFHLRAEKAGEWMWR